MSDVWLRYLPRPFRERLESRHELRKVIDNAGWLVVDNVLRMGVGLIVGVWVARYLGPERFGLLSYCVSLVGIYSAIALMGLDTVVVRELVRYPSQKGEILGTAFCLRLVAGFVSYVAVSITICLIRPTDVLAQNLVGILGWTLVLLSLNTIDLWFQSEVLSRYVVYAKNIGFLASSLLRIGLIVSKAPLMWFAVANLAEAGFAAIGVMFAYYYKRQTIRSWALDRGRVKTMLRHGWPVLLAGIVGMINLRIDQVMLGQLADSREVGLYAAAVRVAEVWFFVPTAIVASVFPNIVRAKEVDMDEFRLRMQKLYRLLAFLAYIIALLTSITAVPVVVYLFGNAYANAAFMLVVLIWSNIFIGFAVARFAFVMAMDYTWMLMPVVIIGAIFNIVLNIFLIPSFGGIGAAFASLISYWIGAHGVCYLFKSLKDTGRMMTSALVNPLFWR